MKEIERQEFAREVCEVYRNLREALSRLEKLTTDNPIPPENIVRVKRILPYFRDRLASHFQIAEKHGFFEDILELRPDMDATINNIFETHHKMIDEIGAICAYADKVGVESAFNANELRRRFRDFDLEFQQLEQRKVDLIQEAYNTDLGVM